MKVNMPPEKKLTNHYVNLGVEKNASDTEIKRAYFQLVRKYQPDHYPEEFKKIRLAYETLMDPAKRAEYDAVSDLPDAVVEPFREAVWQTHHGHIDEAINLYEKILKTRPELTKVTEMYATAFELALKFGKAAEVWEKLTKQNPDSAKYARKLANCYMERGWSKKAYEESQRAVTLEPSNVHGWSLLIDSILARRKQGSASDELLPVFDRADSVLKTVKTDEWKKTYIYTCAFIFSASKHPEKAVKFLHEVIRLVRENGRQGQEEGEYALDNMLEVLPPDLLAKYYSDVEGLVDQLPDITDEATLDQLEEVQLCAEVDSLKNNGFDKIFESLFWFLMLETKSAEDELEIMAIECTFLDDKHIYDSQLRRLKKEHPELYAIHAAFFNEVLRTRDPDKMIYLRIKKMSKLRREAGIEPEDSEDEDKPIRRETPKVGRNDPCPCGSGKKYKKCCGA